MIQSITIGSITFSGTGPYALTGLRGLEMAPIRLSSYDLPGADFGRFVSSYFGRRRFALEGVAIGSDVTDFLQKRTDLITTLGAQTEQQVLFTLTDGRELRLVAATVMLDFAPRAGIPAASPFRAEFEAAMPFLESALARIYEISLPTGGGGSVPASVPMSLNFGSGGSAFVTNQGDAPAFPTLRITGPVTNPAIRNNATNEELSFAITLATGEYLDIDFRAFTVTDQSGRNRLDTKGGDWWSLGPGTSEVRFIADSDDPAALATVTVRSAYRGF